MPKYRILVVDDQRDVRHMLRTGLQTLGQDINVVDVPSGEEAILLLSRQPIDLLVADVRLPGISGLELKERAQVRNPAMKFILITGMTEPKIRREVANAGANAFFFKPIELADFLDTVEICLGLKQVAAPPPVVEAPITEELVRQGIPEEIVKEFARQIEESLPAQGLSERLAGLRQDVDAACVVLLNEQGEVVAEAGEIPEIIGGDSIFPSVMATFGDVLKVSYFLGITSPKDLMFFEGKVYDLFLTHVGQTMGLLLVVPEATWDDQEMWKFLGAVRASVQDLLVILTQMGVAGEETGVPESRKLQAEAEQESAIAEILPELDAIFNLETKEQLKSQDVDAFWDTLSTGEAEELQRADAISYEQAQKLGLAPEE